MRRQCHQRDFTQLTGKHKTPGYDNLVQSLMCFEKNSSNHFLIFSKKPGPYFRENVEMLFLAAACAPHHGSLNPHHECHVYLGFVTLQLQLRLLAH